MSSAWFKLETPEGPMYRHWHNTSDTWRTEPLTREQAIAAGAPVDWIDTHHEDTLVYEWWLNFYEDDCRRGYHNRLGYGPTPDVCAYCGAKC